jgi:hypothetical protein
MVQYCGQLNNQICGDIRSPQDISILYPTATSLIEAPPLPAELAPSKRGGGDKLLKLRPKGHIIHFLSPV